MWKFLQKIIENKDNNLVQEDNPKLKDSEVFKISFTATDEGKVIINVDQNDRFQTEPSILAELVHFMTSVTGTKHTVDTIKSALDSVNGELYQKFITELKLLKSVEVKELTESALAEQKRPMINPLDAT